MALGEPFSFISANIRSQTRQRSDVPAWQALQSHLATLENLNLRKLFADDPGRGERMATEAVGVYFDYSKNRITDETLKLLTQLATESGLRSRIEAMFGGEKINVTEKRAVLHTALRAPRGNSIIVDGTNVVHRRQSLDFLVKAFNEPRRSERS